ncbi:MAG TPA: YdeI/OmpD-associated family protein [Puia sp.]|jgi:uncharacterized protein YdeI (YjbR/CyaY-like superfamily)
MPETDPRVDAYLEKAAPFAKPILIKLRKLIFRACPDAKESIKWSFPNYEIYGSMLCSMAAFKEHCAFGFWKASLLRDPEGILRLADKNSMGHLNKISSAKDLPADAVLIAYLKEASLLNKNKVKPLKRPSAPKKELEVPQLLADELKKNKKALTVFEAFSSSNRREYIEWINEAKTEETMNKRLATTIEWLKEGKSRNWKYKR